MIKLTRAPKPNILISHEKQWQQELRDAIVKHKGYKNISKEEKVKLASHYRHDEIKEVLFRSSNQKCAFCEMKPGESGNIEVEHFIPKSLYPESTYCWENLLPACRKCNGSKSDHDSVEEPIFNPYELDPRGSFEYEDIKIFSLQGQYKAICSLTIEVCELNSVRLMRPRAAILVELHSLAESINKAISSYNEATTPRVKENKKRALREAIEVIDHMAEPTEVFSGYCRQYLEKCEQLVVARKLIETD